MSHRHHCRKQACPSLAKCQHQRGFKLIELMLGLSIGLLVVVSALGTLIMSRKTPGIISKIGALPIDASHAFRVIGEQIRQTNAFYPVQHPVGSRQYSIYPYSPSLD